MSYFERWRLPRRAILLSAGLVAVAGGLGWAIGVSSAQDEHNARAYARHRIPVINAKLRDVESGFIIFSGDSHADLYRQPSSLCGRDTVNAGVSGANADVYSETLAQLSFPRRAALAVLTIGTNDLLRKRAPDPDAFLVRVSRVLDGLQKKADLIVVTAVPPVGEKEAKNFNVEAIESYSQVIAQACSGVDGCSFHDPYASLRSSNFGVSRPGAMADGIHVASYRKVYATLPLCALIAQAQ
ncbi:SGNH/GDSL hydrolase family protein [Microvirga lotononidis]|uniref:SGNH hydrolase-type esterase domain-containing protein n=1 Tax=Microvirga lotononidis TaxID=864069 RepID=I4YNQ3_9HYPH|nr:SGNH/GDSL hydrolase family protein [Microvirga lotononidis]EIM25595.1 hypothetical protein MicloDRAFT_00063220 [Microvirga lotononidis]WQO26100.1 SGNH/GDSL hydrolase family protein [Microvirga lotononidis]